MAADYENWIKKVEINWIAKMLRPAFDQTSCLSTGCKSKGCTVQCTHSLWALQFDAPQFADDNCREYHLFNDIVSDQN